MYQLLWLSTGGEDKVDMVPNSVKAIVLLLELLVRIIVPEANQCKYIIIFVLSVMKEKNGIPP